MARKLDQTQLDEFAAFLEELAQRGDWKTDAEWSRQSGVHAVNLSEARTGKSQLDGYNLLRLIRATAERTASAQNDAAISASRATGPLAALEAKVEEIADRTADSLLALERALESGIARIEKRLPGEDDPDQKAG